MTFAARYPGRCHAGCGESIEPGDLVRYEEEALVHVDCPMTSARARPHPVPHLLAHQLRLRERVVTGRRITSLLAAALPLDPTETAA